MKIVVDDKIPFIRESIERLADTVVYKNGSMINASDVRDADALVVRTRTHCDEKLLAGSSVRFIATATIGFDHLDTSYLRQAGIEWMSCPGCNAGSVAQYVQSVLLLLKRVRGYKLRGMTMGIVGCGHVGSKVRDVALAEGMKVLLCDPPRQEVGDGGGFVSLSEIEEHCDVITFHVPLTTDGPHATLHLADKGFFGRIRKRPVVINTSRGAVVDGQALKRAIIYNKVSAAVIDTWEDEPQIDRELLDLVWIGTPHIAGYSADGKVNADNMVIDGLCLHFGLPPQRRIEPPALPRNHPFSLDEDTLKLLLYNPMDDCQRLRLHPEEFESLRGNYPLRREIFVI